MCCCSSRPPKAAPGCCAGSLPRTASCVASRAGPELLHFDPDTGEDLSQAEHATEHCAQACYDCLLSYGNQWDHQHLDRHTVNGLLQTTDARPPWRSAATGGEDRAAQLARLDDSKATAWSDEFLRFLDDARLPAARRRPGDGRRATTSDPTSPTTPRRRRRGVPRRAHPRLRASACRKMSSPAKLEDEAGWLVLRFHHRRPPRLAASAQQGE